MELCHLLLDLDLTHSSRTVVTVNCRKEEEQSEQYDIGNRNLEYRDLSLLAKYKQRDQLLRADVTYLDFLLHYNFKSVDAIKPRPSAQERVLSYRPRYKPEGASREDYCRVKMMLHHPFTSMEQLLQTPDDSNHPFTDYCHAFQYCIANHPPHTRDYLDENPGQVTNEDEFEEGDDRFNDFVDEHWEALAQELRERGGLHPEDPDLLGCRDSDRIDWRHHIMSAEFYPDITAHYWKQAKRDYPARLEAQAVGEGDFTRRQGLVFRTVVQHYQGSFRPSQPQLLLNVDGQAGTGKSYIIHRLSDELERLASQYDHRSPILRAAPTGVAANVISGRTLPTLFQLPVKLNKPCELTGVSLNNLQLRLRHCRYLIIDEKSMISPHMLEIIDSQYRQVFPTTKDQNFGGLNIILFGDFAQLPPVLDKPLFNRCRIEQPPRSSWAYSLQSF
jgi:hypothetical protein